MFWLICAFLFSPAASADFSPKVPEVLQEKWAETKVLVSSGVATVQEKYRSSGASGLGEKLKQGVAEVRQSDFFPAVVAKAGAAWRFTKETSKGAIIAADQMLHEHVIDEPAVLPPRKK